MFISYILDIWRINGSLYSLILCREPEFTLDVECELFWGNDSLKLEKMTPDSQGPFSKLAVYNLYIDFHQIFFILFLN